MPHQQNDGQNYNMKLHNTSAQNIASWRDYETTLQKSEVT